MNIAAAGHSPQGLKPDAAAGNAWCKFVNDNRPGALTRCLGQITAMPVIGKLALAFRACQSAREACVGFMASEETLRVEYKASLKLRNPSLPDREIAALVNTAARRMDLVDDKVLARIENSARIQNVLNDWRGVQLDPDTRERMTALLMHESLESKGNISLPSYDELGLKSPELQKQLLSSLPDLAKNLLFRQNAHLLNLDEKPPTVADAVEQIAKNLIKSNDNEVVKFVEEKRAEITEWGSQAKKLFQILVEDLIKEANQLQSSSADLQTKENKMAEIMAEVKERIANNPQLFKAG